MHYSEEDRSKPWAPALIGATGTLLGAALVTLLGWYLTTNDRDARAAGQTVADAMAALSADRLVQENYAALSVLTQRLVQRPGINAGAVFTLDHIPVAEAGRSADDHSVYTAPVFFEEAMIGYVTVTVAPSAPLPWPALLLTALLAACMTAAWLRIAQGGRTVPTGHAPEPEAPVVNQPAASAEAGAPEESDAPPPPAYLFVLLYNHLSLGPAAAVAVAEALELAEAVAELYGAGALALSEHSLILEFPAETEPGDHRFQEICAALLLAHVLAQRTSTAEPKPQFRLALHAGDSPRDALDDVRTLAAVTPDEQVAVSARAMDTLTDPSPLERAPLNHPLLEDQGQLGGSAWRIDGVDDAHWSHLALQAERLLQPTTTDDSIANPAPEDDPVHERS